MVELELPFYPHQPGYRREGPSRVAAERVAHRAPGIRGRALALLKDASLTADEVAAALNVTVLACRPRITELFRQGKIYDTGRTRANDSGLQATVWRSHP